MKKFRKLQKLRKLVCKLIGHWYKDDPGWSDDCGEYVKCRICNHSVKVGGRPLK